MKERPELNADLNITWILQLLSHSDAEVLKHFEGKSAWDNSHEAMHENSRSLKNKKQENITRSLRDNMRKNKFGELFKVVVISAIKEISQWVANSGGKTKWNWQ